MAYTPTDWECGQTVTAEKLNNIERGVADVNSEYTPTTWQCGDLITAEAMNKIEQGIANAGGGGSSDFSTAKVTVNGALRGNVSAPVISPSPTGFSLFPFFGEVGSYDIVIYTGGTILSYDGSGTVSVSGNIQKVGGNTYIVTGDCTITIS